MWTSAACCLVAILLIETRDCRRVERMMDQNTFQRVHRMVFCFPDVFPRLHLDRRDDGFDRVGGWRARAVRVRPSVPSRRAQRLGGRLSVPERGHREGILHSGRDERRAVGDRDSERSVALGLHDDVDDGHRRATHAVLRPQRPGVAPGGGQSRRVLVPRRGDRPPHGLELPDRRKWRHNRRQPRDQSTGEERPELLRGGVRAGRQGLLPRLPPRPHDSAGDGLRLQRREDHTVDVRENGSGLRVWTRQTLFTRVRRR